MSYLQIKTKIGLGKGVRVSDVRPAPAFSILTPET